MDSTCVLRAIINDIVASWIRQRPRPVCVQTAAASKQPVESISEIFRQDSIKYRIHAAVRESNHMREDLNHDSHITDTFVTVEIQK